MDENVRISQLKEFDKAYFEGNPIIEDAHYDMIKKEAKELFPNNQYFSEVGAPVRGSKVKLPYPMGSLDQIYENEYQKWIDKYNITGELIITEKLDGMSVLLIYEGEDLRLKCAYSRGNGIEGADITRHIRYVSGIPKKLSIDGCTLFVIRGEVIMKNKIFDSKYSKDNKNPRNMVAGCMNRKVTDQHILKDIDMLAYEIVANDKSEYSTKNEDLKLLRELGFLVVNSESVDAKTVDDSSLVEQFSRMKSDSDYELDGIVITCNDYANLQKLSKSSSLNPEHSVKFKSMSDDSIVDTEVVDVHWKISKSGFFKPRVQIIPVELFGTTVTYATGFNGKFIYENGIGPKAKIRVTKAGSVIPYIVSVTEKSKPKMPDSYEWDELGVEVKTIDKDNFEIVFMQAVHFFKTLSVEQLQETSLSKLVDYLHKSNIDVSSFEKLVSEVIYLLDRDWKEALGSNGIKSFNSLHKTLSSIKEETLLGATPFFGQGFGVRKAKKLMAKMSIDEFLSSKEEDISAVEGFDKTSTNVVSGIPDFISFYKKIEDFIEFNSSHEITSNKLEGHSIVMTGFRDKMLQEKIESLGGKVSSGVSKKTTILIVADKTSSSSKLNKAKELNITILDKDEFEYDYIL